MTERKKVLVTGASSGVGKATAVRFGREGWDVCLVARRAAELAAVRSSLPDGDHLVCPADYGMPAQVEAIGAEIGKRWGRLDSLVNSAGIYIQSHSVDGAVEQWRQAFQTMVDGGVYITRLAVPFMSQGGRIIHITSIHGDRAEAWAAGYSMAKAALNQYCRVLAIDLAPRGILANAIAPGFIDTPMSVYNGVNELESEWFRQNYVVGHHLPLRRPAQPEEIAGVAWFLAGPDAGYITGQVITVDGGLTITF